MGADSKIEWTHHTFNPWIGCTDVGPGCLHCYARSMMQDRYGRVQWGAGQPRVRTSEANWNLPLKWDRACARAGIRQRVFCASLADVFDNEVDPQWRYDLGQLIEATPNLDWLLLTKRIGNVFPRMWAEMFGSDVPSNVWLGATIVNQAEADRDIPKLLATPAAKRFLSMEPLLGPVDVRRWMPDCYECGASCGLRLPGHPDVERCTECGEECGPETEPAISEGCPKCGGELEFVCPDCGSYMVYQHPDTPNLDWIIVGGESGPVARPMHPDWARSLRDQCAVVGVPFLFKQWGEWADMRAARIVSDGPVSGRSGNVRDWMSRYVVFEDDAGAARVRGHSFTEHATDLVYRVGKKAAGRLLDGVQHDGVPT